MHYAVRQSSEELVRLLLENGADPNARTPSGLMTPLHRAAGRGRAEIVKLLLGELLLTYTKKSRGVGEYLPALWS